jgi:pimeloyl-ACP methyl ester carboxylesterase
MRLLKIAARVLAFAAIALVLMLLSCQSRLIYFPRPYGKASLHDLEQRHGKVLEFTTSQGKQTAFYLPPRANPEKEPEFVWIVTGGNGALALDYAGEPLRWDARFGYLFVDYPGYGACAGAPTPGRIKETSLAAAEMARKELGWSEEKFRERAGVFGHSMGCAAALMTADDLKLKSAVLCAPFTTMTEMGRRVLGWPLCCLNLHRFDNVTRLRSLDQLGARVHMYHGSEDEVIPVEMSRQMQQMFPNMVRFTEVEGGRHNDVVMGAAKDIGVSMQELAGMR